MANRNALASLWPHTASSAPLLPCRLWQADMTGSTISVCFFSRDFFWQAIVNSEQNERLNAHGRLEPVAIVGHCHIMLHYFFFPGKGDVKHEAIPVTEGINTDTEEFLRRTGVWHQVSCCGLMTFVLIELRHLLWDRQLCHFISAGELSFWA